MLFSHCPKHSKFLISIHGDNLCDGCRYRKDHYTDEEATLIHAVCTVQDYINFGDFCHESLGVTTQYGYYMLEGLAGHPTYLGEGIRKIDDCGGNYHAYMIHKDDAEQFKQRVTKWRNGDSL